MPVPHSETYLKQATPPKTSSEMFVEITRVTPIWPKRVYIQWVVRNAPAATGFVFNIYRSASLTGPWEKLTDDLADAFYYIDEDLPGPQDRTKIGLVQLRMAVNYKVTCSYLGNPEVEAVRNIEGGVDHRRRGIVRKLTRDAYLSLRKGNGTEVAILKRKWYGDACPVCRTTTGQSSRAHCGTCNGTGIVKGYWNPMYSYARRTASPMDTATAPQGIVDSNRLMAVLPSFPEVAAEDVLVFLRDARRYIIERVKTTEIHAVTIHQECDVSELARTSREYKLEVDPYHVPGWF